MSNSDNMFFKKWTLSFVQLQKLEHEADCQNHITRLHLIHLTMELNIAKPP